MAGIFGSFAKGRVRGPSDVDVCVAGRKILSSRRKMDLANELAVLVKREVDLVDLCAVSGTILKEALGGARWVKRCDPVLFASIIKRQLFDDADFAPLYNRMLKTRRERFLAE